MESETQSGDSSRWEAHPRIAALLRAFILLAPIAASVAFVHVASSLIRPPGGSTLMHVAWWVGLSGAATVVLIGIDRLTRRLLPLTALLKLALVFPDEAPSRFRTALGSGTTADLEQRLERAREGADSDYAGGVRRAAARVRRRPESSTIASRAVIPSACGPTRR